MDPKEHGGQPLPWDMVGAAELGAVSSSVVVVLAMTVSCGEWIPDLDIALLVPGMPGGTSRRKPEKCKKCKGTPGYAAVNTQ